MMQLEDLSVLALKAEEWVQGCTGPFSAFVFGRELGVMDPVSRDMILADLVDSKVIEPVGDKHGHYKLVRSECHRIDWLNASEEYAPLWLPLGLDKMVGLRGKNIVVVAGGNNAGKTLFALQVAHNNLRQNGGGYEHVWYFNSEMGPGELRNRLLGIDSRVESWAGLEPWERSSDFHAVIRPDGLNIVDYMEISDKFYLVADMIQRIHAALRNGIAIICLQKSPDKDVGRGGEFTLEKPRLALALSHHFGVNVCKITKCKCPRNGSNPQGQEMHYRIIDGSRVEVMREWTWLTSREKKLVLNGYEIAQAAKETSEGVPF